MSPAALRRRTLLRAALLGPALLLAACKRTPAPPPPLAEAAGGGIRLTDQAGASVRLPRAVQRVATPGISMASLVLVIGGPASLVAITPEVAGNPWLARILPAVASLPTPFTRPAGVSLEALLRTRPELVTLWRGNDGLRRRLEGVGIPVLQLGYTTPEELQQAALLLGEALGPAARLRARCFVQRYRDNLAQVARGLAGLPDAARPRVYYAALSPLQTEGRASMIDAWISAAGGRNVATDALRGDGHVHLEDVLRWDPQIIVTLGPAQRRAILADPRWRDVSAVRQGRVHANPRGINAWCTRAAEAALQVLWAAKTFHPERFATLDIAAAARDFYSESYAYVLSDEELARVLQSEDPPANTAPARSPA